MVRDDQFLFEYEPAVLRFGTGSVETLADELAEHGLKRTLVVSMVLLAKAVQDLPIGTAYAVWTGIGAVGTASLGIVLFDELATGAHLLFIYVIVFGIVGLHFVSGGH